MSIFGRQTLGVLALLAAVVYTITAQRNEDRIGINVLRHEPCRGDFLNQSRIFFPSGREAPLQSMSRNGCYRIGGRVRITKALRAENLQVRFDLKYNVDTPSEKCFGGDPATGFGGWGSCMHNNSCAGLRDVLDGATQYSRITVNNRPLSCSEVIPEGEIQEFYIMFCLPSKREFLRSQNIAEQTWEELVRSKGAGGKLSVFLTVFIYDEAVNRYFNLMQIVKSQYADRYGVEWDVDPQANRTEPRPTALAALLDKKAIACHKIYGNIYVV